MTSSLGVTKVTKRFGRGESAVEVLRDISLDAEPGECVSIIGPSGCGKSTLLRLIAGLEQLSSADAGEILVDGKPADRMAGHIGFVFQAYSTFPWLTAKKNVLLALAGSELPPLHRERVALQHLASVRLSEFANTYPDRLSGGQRQRLAFACALAKRPALLLLDEPLGALDALTRERLQIELLKLWLASRSTMVLVTHDISEALLLGHRVLVMCNRPASFILEIDARFEKPWLNGGAGKVPIEEMVRETWKSRAFVDAEDQLRDALS
ncbi:MAG TPA: ABC transporter ATP-binding protein [Allosphingosinicella sp.]